MQGAGRVNAGFPQESSSSLTLFLLYINPLMPGGNKKVAHT